MTAEFELTMRLRNNRLKQRRMELRFSQKDLAEAAGLTRTKYAALENMACSPLGKCYEKTAWSKAALRLAQFHCVEPEDLFPTAVLAVTKPVQTKQIDAAEFHSLLSTNQERLLAGPGEAYDRALASELLRKLIATLPDRQRAVVRLRFGIEGGQVHTSQEVADLLGVSAGRVRQIEDRALYTLQGSGRGFAHATKAGILAEARGYK